MPVDILEAPSVHEALVAREAPSLTAGREALSTSLPTRCLLSTPNARIASMLFVASTISLFVNDLKNGSTRSMA